MSKRLLITGGAGFIGSNFVHYLCKHYPDYEIWIVDLLTYAGSVDNLPSEFVSSSTSKLKLIYGNICNADLMNKLVSQVDVIVHFAAETHVTRSIDDNREFFQTDVIGTQTVMNAVAANRNRIERIVHISTSEVYGTAETEKIAEDHPLNPRSPYASAKCGADRLVYSYILTYGLPAVMVRPFNVYGPRQHLEKLIPRLINSFLMGSPMTIHGQGMAARDYTYVDDLCRALDLIVHAPCDQVVGEVFNVASGIHRSIMSIARDLMRLQEQPDFPIEYLSERPGQVDRHTGDWSKISRVLGWEPRIDWETGLHQTTNWYSQNEQWWRKQMWLRSIPITLPNGAVENH
jgi:dTDP-glucose 4,6-dehydratase